MIEGLLWWQWIIGAAMFVVLAASTFVLVLALTRFSSQLSQEERRAAEQPDLERIMAEQFEGTVLKQRERMHTVADDEHGTARTDLTAFAGLLLCMALVGAAIWAASGWWG